MKNAIIRTLEKAHFGNKAKGKDYGSNQFKQQRAADYPFGQAHHSAKFDNIKTFPDQAALF